ncbi:leucyl aminopeptidase [archaeon]|jgi:leucyl aminopeptidase|nr:leucyl aminopeptidase [archaeon]MBT6698282.1 leucyl aminopeptidase [archaeon]
MMDIKFLTDDLKEQGSDAIVIPCFEDEEQNNFLDLCGDDFASEYQRLLKNKVFTAKALTTSTINTLGKINADNIILIGLGEKKDLTAETIRRAASKAHKKVKALKANSYVSLLNQVSITNLSSSSATVNEIIAEVVLLANYEFNLYRKKSIEEGDNYHGPSTMHLWSAKQANKSQLDKIAKAQITAEATCFVRDLVNTSPHEMYPEILAKHALSLKAPNTKVTVFDEKQLLKMGCNGILAVGKGSQRPPRLIVIDYNPKTKTNSKSVAIVGKGITFDSGGLNIKPGKYMETMKSDMSGAANAIAIIKAVQKLKIPKRVFAICACAENMPSGKSYRPDDVITMYSGKTAEIGNTDAEGRIVLGDALAYTEKNIKPDQMIDFATLTGACVVALGNFTSGLMTTQDDMASDLTNAGLATGDKVWRLPLWEDYKSLMKSSIADVRNISSGRAAGSITAAIFLQHFVEKTPWAHIDIAGTAFLDKAHHYNPKGATGSGVRLILEYLRQ